MFKRWQRTCAVGLILCAASWLVAQQQQAQKQPGQPGKGVVLEVSGYVVPSRQVTVSAQVAGEVVEVKVEEGTKVKQGDLLAHIDPAEYQAEVERTQALVEQAQARLQELQAGPRKEEVARAEAALNEEKEKQKFLQEQMVRMLRLGGAVSAEDLARAKAQLQQAEQHVEAVRLDLELVRAGARKERIDEARAAVKAAAAELNRARLSLDRTNIRAPFAGTILVKRVEKGTLVMPAGLNVPCAICDLADMSRPEVELTIQEVDIHHVFKGQKCEVKADADPNTTYKGSVLRLLPIADRARAAIGVRVQLDTPAKEHDLRPEMKVRVRLLAKE